MEDEEIVEPELLSPKFFWVSYVYEMYLIHDILVHK